MRILILTASPVRDKLIDELIAEELKARGHEVLVKPCLREGRKSCLEFKPDVVVTPPIRNPYSRDFVEVLKYHGCGIVSRHTEASCDWSDWKKMSEAERMEIAGRFPYVIDKELVWGSDEAQILTQRKCPFPVIPVGAFGLDVYKQNLARFGTREDFLKKYGFEDKKTLLIACPWGFADSAPDLNIEDTSKAKRDIEGRARHIKMIKEVCEKLDWNVLVTLHPGVAPDEYKKEITVPIDTSRASIELLVHCDALIHSGSTMGIEMHMLDKPAFQYQDVNQKITAGWWGKTGTPLSRVSPEFEKVEDLIEAVKACEPKSNASAEAIQELINGRYGVMDGLAYKRAADEIEKVKGKWIDKWDRPIRDYTQPMCFKVPETAVITGMCGICGEQYSVINRDWMYRICEHIKGNKEEVDKLFNVSCPHCCSKFYLPWQQ